MRGRGRDGWRERRELTHSQVWNFVDDLILQRSEATEDDDGKGAAENVLKHRQLFLGGGGEEGGADGAGTEDQEREKAEMREKKCVVYCFFPDNDLVVGQTFVFDFGSTVQGWANVDAHTYQPNRSLTRTYTYTLSHTHLQCPFSQSLCRDYSADHRGVGATV